jgi:ubiquinone/menaquinone biosynthesis C-methylase UbiE
VKELSDISQHTHVCPWWLAYSFDNPLRRIFHKPERMFDGHVKSGSRVLDIGCGMGYFTIAFARMVGDDGVVYGVDLQEKMLAAVRRRAERYNLLTRVHLQKSTADAINVDETFDFILAFWMVHEVPDQSRFLADVHAHLSPAGRFLIAEPKLHVSLPSFDKTVQIAREAGLTEIARPTVALSRAVLFSR